MADPNPNTGNPSSLDRRRDERTAEQVAQYNAGRMIDVMTCYLDVWRAQIAMGEAIIQHVGETMNGTQAALSHLISTTHRAAEQQQRRAS